jgi:hypothetical protein
VGWFFHREVMVQRRASSTQLFFLPVGRFAPDRIFERWWAADAHIGRALMTTPDLALLDDPTEGLAPLIGSMLEEQIMSFLFFWNQLASLVF